MDYHIRFTFISSCIRITFLASATHFHLSCIHFTFTNWRTCITFKYSCSICISFPLIYSCSTFIFITLKYRRSDRSTKNLL
ncbi:hypothetical protein GLOIN_2v1582532 [Rhizophagus irregularis DAOM 181602=DAOM 197198]|uniref:Uncharacterized protein n=1 Tax=Rhizophagus irregularis (strain DAOM 181602 / DAOM 197198 / MUCL 43194) TaxID=747089 RepID=A0A2P4Q7X8_RHIID|nr:hypothetical protein GLOIN_2v1582532 [Rhizophagus irregularis DAOM 181602=DAOM 197198]POG73761.1 hypothetical protein GLOIN_2v1582532 [Rhizophagus irregularis DAOM 181602=DAOM 197198]|eukprot:XP_025180627.1 hypothetical protein GLOIN_2v1582532 [Rhizophagus irregularis DAOM 181602=DAOM 197198]